MEGLSRFSMIRLKARGFHFYEGKAKWLARGITYGPFCPDEQGHCYPAEERLREDFEAIASLGINVIRLYSPPNELLARIAEELNLRLLIDVPWPKHLDVYNNPEFQQLCFKMVDEAVMLVRQWPNVMGVLLGNEIPADLVRWSGAAKVSDFLQRLYLRAKQLAPELLVGFSNYPSTEYLPLSFFDFVGFNVYLHDAIDMRKYLMRLRHLYPDQPLVLSETGVDTQGSGEDEQARVLRLSLETAFEIGMAGAFVFSWTDEWFTGGYNIDEWAFGIVDAERRPKQAFHVVQEVYRSAPQSMAPARVPKISVVVCSYNGGATLDECLASLREIKYPNYEVIVVDDGSTDNTPEILARYPEVNVISQENCGLSAARNAGIAAATGEIVAFTDSDCIVDPDWLHHLAVAMEQKSVAGVGGPNLTPDEATANHRAVGAAPGHATHVMLDEEIAEHVPGCNMAFWRDILLEVGGFDPQFRTAGDDVDIIWRMQDRNLSIGFAPGAFVWHHRRSTVGAYLRQQRGYGYAEAMLMRKHPFRFNDRGQSMWRGVICSGREQSDLFGPPHIHYGVFASAGYQCIYARRQSFLVHFMTSLEWWLLCIGFIIVGTVSNAALIMGGLATAVSLYISGARAWRQCRGIPEIPRSYFPLIWLLWVLQPVVREGSRYWAHLRGRGPSQQFHEALRDGNTAQHRFLARSQVAEYWGEKVPGRITVLRAMSDRMTWMKWIFSPNTGWEPWDITVITSWWFKTRITTAEEDHGDNKRLLRIKYRIVPSSLLFVFSGIVILLSATMAFHDHVIARIMLVVGFVILWWTYRRARRARHLIQRLADELVTGMGYLLINPAAQSERDELIPVSESDPQKI